MIDINLLRSLAVKEVKRIKKHATKKQINLLNEYFFNPKSVNECIYGQMTGHCESIAAKKLIAKCCDKVIDTRNVSDILKGGKLNGKPDKNVPANSRILHYISPVESYIVRRKRAGKKIIKFLKGETKTLGI